jgi:hypothetical protein
MALDTNFNVNPYYDDFDEDKKFLRLLFKPGFAVQARELTQLQTLAQNQIDRFGRHIFVNGGLVEGGQTFLQQADYLILDEQFSGFDINLSSFEGQTILSLDESKRAEVIRVYDKDEGTGDPITLIVKQLYGDAFVPGETIKTNEASPAFATISSNGVGRSLTFSVNEGVYFYDGFFIKASAQTIAISKYNTNGSGKIGFEVSEAIVLPNEDTSLLDPALDASNFQAPGADRYKIDLVLASRSLDSTDTERFIEISRVADGTLDTTFTYPIYSVIQDEFARRTYDESGNYTVRPFQLSLATNSANSAQTEITLSPGKAYIFGYEFSTNAPTKLIVPKPRDKVSINNKFLNADYGSFVYTTNTFGSLPIDSLQTIDLHCVPVSGLNTSSTAAISNTKIGTARVLATEFDSAINLSSSSTYTFRTHIFDIKVDNDIVGVSNNVTSNTVQLSDVNAGNIYSVVNDAYVGARLRITSGPGSNESPKQIISFDPLTQTVGLAERFITTPNNNSPFAIIFDFSETESYVVNTGTTIVSSGNIDDRSKDLATRFNDTIILETQRPALVFPIGEDYVANNISDMVYTYRKLYSTTFGATDSGSLAVDSGESLVSATTGVERLQNYQIYVKNNRNSAPYANGSIVPPQSIINVDTNLNFVSVLNANNMTADIVATVAVSSSTQKNKTLVTPSATVQTTGGQTILSGGVIVYANNTSGQTTIQSNNVVKIPGNEQSLYVADVVRLVSVFDFNGNAVANTGYTDVTERYSLDNGQRDSFYDHASIRLRPGFPAPNGPLVVRYEYFASADVGGYFSVDSYPNYDDIPVYNSPVTGRPFELRDCLDFRPVRKNATSALGTSVEFRVGASVDNPKIVRVGSDIILDYEYYLPRIDKIVLNKNRTFEVVTGISSKIPREPRDRDNSMTLYVLRNPAYVDDTREIGVDYIESKRYTMKDIGNIEKRVDNLEYYTSLSLLEQDTLNKQDLTILDSTNTPRFKNGIITDGFRGHSVADVGNIDYTASIDTNRFEVRPSFRISAHRLNFTEMNSVNYQRSGQLITANSSFTGFIDQPLVSRFINVNPFNVINFLGKIELTPPSDIWVDTETRPEVLVNLGGNEDAWQLILDRTGLSNWTFEWDSWQDRWTGTPVSTVTTRNDWWWNWGWDGDDWWLGTFEGRWGWWWGFRNETTTVSQTVGQTRTGVASRLTPGRITSSIGDRVVDVSIIPFMREINVLFTGTDFKPSSTLYPFFDGVPVEQFVANRANKLIFETNDLRFGTGNIPFEFVSIVDANTSVELGEAVSVLTSNNILYVTNVLPYQPFTGNVNVIGDNSQFSAKLIAYEHNGANAQSATSNTITLRIDAEGASNIDTYNTAPIFIVEGAGKGQVRTITNYNPATRVATVNQNWDVIPDSDSFYSIGRLKTDASGRVAGIFSIPSGTFRVGEKLFRLVDNVTGDVGSSSTNGDATFFAQGLLQTQEEVIVSVTAPVIQRQDVTEDRVINRVLSQTTRRVPRFFAGWSDPLAQTFLVSPNNFESGIFIDRVRLCFKSKDPIIPVTVQLRPTENGYPSSSVVFPFGTVSLTPDKVNITDSPNLDDPTKYTDFVFESPVFVQPGEYSFVVLANSNKYEVYAAEIGKRDIVTNQLISEQPYGGSLFLSQNGSTWTADQNTDMMFRLFRRNFDTSLVEVEFRVEPPPEDVKYDVIHPITNQIAVEGTGITYGFVSEKETGGLTDTKPLTPLQNYEMNDGDGRRILNTATGNSTFVVKTVMATRDPAVSPVLDTSRFGFIAIENLINDLPLLENDFVIENPGTGYTGNVGITISDPTDRGVRANAFAEVVDGSVVSVKITQGGSGYTTSPIITVDEPPVPSGNTTAIITYNGEDKKSGGNSVARYISRRVNLADGFDSGDLRVYITAYRPAGSRIAVYYKILSQSDTGRFEDKDYQLMTQLDNLNFTSSSEGDYRELTFAPGVNGIPDNTVSYESDGVTYTSFRSFAIKIVLAGNDPTDVPKVRDFRAIALPAG